MSRIDFSLFVFVSFGYFVQVSAFWIHIGEVYHSCLLDSSSPSGIFVPLYSPFSFIFSRIEDNVSFKFGGVE